MNTVSCVCLLLLVAHANVVLGQIILVGSPPKHSISRLAVIGLTIAADRMGMGSLCLGKDLFLIGHYPGVLRHTI